MYRDGKMLPPPLTWLASKSSGVMTRHAFREPQEIFVLRRAAIQSALRKNTDVGTGTLHDAVYLLFFADPH